MSSAHRRPFQRSNYSGWLIDHDALLEALAERGITPRHPHRHAEHVTHRYPDAEPAPHVESLMVVGHAADDEVDCVVVEVCLPDGEPTSHRADGSTYHCTVSCADGVKPVASNRLLRQGWTPIDPFELAAISF
jgi:hypothetical protein